MRMRGGHFIPSFVIFPGGGAFESNLLKIFFAQAHDFIQINIFGKKSIHLLFSIFIVMKIFPSIFCSDQYVSLLLGWFLNLYNFDCLEQFVSVRYSGYGSDVVCIIELTCSWNLSTECKRTPETDCSFYPTQFVYSPTVRRQMLTDCAHKTNVCSQNKCSQRY